MGPRMREDKGRAVRELAPTRESPNTMKTGNHKGCPYGDGVECRRGGKDGFPSAWE